MTQQGHGRFCQKGAWRLGVQSHPPLIFSAAGTW